MAKHIKVTGVVLYEQTIKESDKRLVILTKEKGKITAFVNGGQKLTSKRFAGSRLFVFADFILYKGREAYTVESIEILDSFFELSNSMETALYASYICELALSFTYEEEINENIFKLIYYAFLLLRDKRYSPRQVKAVFELKILAESGLAPLLDSCVRCENNNQIIAFAPLENGVICKNCKKDTDINMAKEILRCMTYITSSKVEACYSFRLKSPYLEEMAEIIRRYLKCFLDYPLKSEKILKILD